MNVSILSVKKFIMILGEIRIVCRVGIPNVVDLLLGPAGLSCELYYFRILVPKY